MVDVPAFCDWCGLVFPSGFDLGGSRVTLIGNSSQCPRCGSAARIPDGTFDFIDSSIRLIRGPYRSRMELERFQEILELCSRQQPSFEEVDKEIKDTSPAVHTLIRRFAPKDAKDLAAYLGLLFSHQSWFLAAVSILI